MTGGGPGAAIRDLDEIVRHLEPVLDGETYVFSSVPRGADVGALDALATFREAEGTSVVVAESAARRAGLAILFRAARITLEVRSDLAAVGLTAAVATALGEAGISCNVVAAAHHDHLFVPVERASEALGRLRALQAAAGG